MSLRDVILRQKVEIGRLQDKKLVQRDVLDFAVRQMSGEQIKVIVGPRRAGKSAFAAMLLKGTSVAYLNFDEIELTGVSFEEVLTELYAVYPDCSHVFFDEVQELAQWPLALNRLQRDGKNVVVTGSNAHMLSGELLTHLTGRHVPIEILPFSFKEYLRAKGEVPSLLSHFDAFLSRGGYPETVVNAELDAGQYLSGVWNSVIYMDVVTRRNLRRPQTISDIGTWILSNVGRPVSLRNLGNIVGLKSPITVERYLEWLREAYLISRLTRYSHGAGERIRSPKKYYAIDNGLIGAVAVRTSPDNGRLLENAVMVELLKSGHVPERDLFYYASDDARHEVDFLLRKDGLHVTDLIQSCWDISDARTLQREVSGLCVAAEKFSTHGPVRTVIITRNDERTIVEDGQTIEVIPFWKWATSVR